MAAAREALLERFTSKKVVELAEIREALGGVSAMTAFRYLRTISYRRSYNSNGRFYTLHDPARYDRFGLWSVGDIHFSVDGSLKATTRRLIHEAEAGMTHHELLERLRVRVQNTLLDLLREGEVDRERVEQVYVYLRTEARLRAAQLRNRRQQCTVARELAELSDAVIIEILLVLIRHPASRPEQVVRHLHGHLPPITRTQVDAVLARYDLGQKGGPSSC
jgi:hypothetical protein